MTGRVLATWAPLWLLAAGCLEEPRSLLAPPDAGEEVIVARSLNRPVSATTATKATEAVGKRVVAVGHRIVMSNPQLGLRPLFITAGAPYLELFHRGTGGLEGCQVTITEGFVRRCANDAQLAAVLCHELGKIVAEREAAASLEQRQGDEHLPPEVLVGNDTGGTFGPADGTRMMEAGKLEKGRCKRGKKLPVPAPDVLAQQYLKRANYEADSLEQVRPLLREAAEHFSLEKSWTASAGPTAVPKAPATPAAPAAPR